MRLVTFVLKLGALDGSYLSPALSSGSSHLTLSAELLKTIWRGMKRASVRGVNSSFHLQQPESDHCS